MRTFSTEDLNCIALALAVGFLLIIILGILSYGDARAQPSYQNNVVPYCPTGVFDANGNPVVAPCGGPGTPGLIVTEQQHPTQPYQTQACPPNPISKKIPPLC